MTEYRTPDQERHYTAFLDVFIKRVGYTNTGWILEDLEEVPLSKELRDVVQGVSDIYRSRDTGKKTKDG